MLKTVDEFVEKASKEYNQRIEVKISREKEVLDSDNQKALIYLISQTKAMYEKTYTAIWCTARVIREYEMIRKKQTD